MNCKEPAQEDVSRAASCRCLIGTPDLGGAIDSFVMEYMAESEREDRSIEYAEPAMLASDDFSHFGYVMYIR
jgi:hypothetical protein